MLRGAQNLIAMALLAGTVAGQRASLVIESDIPEGGGYLASGTKAEPTKYGARVVFDGRAGLHRVVFRSLTLERREPRSFELQLEKGDQVLVAPEWRSNRWDPDVIAWDQSIASKRPTLVYEIDEPYRISGRCTGLGIFLCGTGHIDWAFTRDHIRKHKPELFEELVRDSAEVHDMSLPGFGVRWFSERDHERIGVTKRGVTHERRVNGVVRNATVLRHLPDSPLEPDNFLEVEMKGGSLRVLWNHLPVYESQVQAGQRVGGKAVVFGHPEDWPTSTHWVLRRLTRDPPKVIDWVRPPDVAGSTTEFTEGNVGSYGDWWCARGGERGALRFGSNELRDYRVETEVLHGPSDHSWQFVALRMRARGPDDYYELRWQLTGEWVLSRRVGGQDSVLRSGKRELLEGWRKDMALEATGFGLAAYLRGERVAALLDGSNQIGAAEIHMHGPTISRPRLVPVPTEAPVTVVIQRGDALLVQRRGGKAGGDAFVLVSTSPTSLELPAALLPLDPLVSECLRSYGAMRTKVRVATGGLPLPRDPALLGRRVFLQTRTVAAGDGSALDASRILALRLR